MIFTTEMWLRLCKLTTYMLKQVVSQLNAAQEVPTENICGCVPTQFKMVLVYITLLLLTALPIQSSPVALYSRGEVRSRSLHTLQECLHIKWLQLRGRLYNTRRGRKGRRDSVLNMYTSGCPSLPTVSSTVSHSLTLQGDTSRFSGMRLAKYLSCEEDRETRS